MVIRMLVGMWTEETMLKQCQLEMRNFSVTTVVELCLG